MDKSYVCLNCEKPFMSGEWYGCRGNKTRKHVIERKTFYSASDREVFNAIPASTMLGSQGERIPIPGKIVEFMGGQYHTDDPEIQEIMNEQYTMTKDTYVNLRLTTEMKNTRLRQKVDDQAALLDQLKARNAELEAQVKGKPEKPESPEVEAPKDEEPEGELVGAAREKVQRRHSPRRH